MEVINEISKTGINVYMAISDKLTKVNVNVKSILNRRKTTLKMT